MAELWMRGLGAVTIAAVVLLTPGWARAQTPAPATPAPAAPAPAESAAPAAPAGSTPPATSAAPLDQAAPPAVTLPQGEAELARDLPIAEVRVVGNRRIATEDVATYLSNMRVGQLFSPEGLSRDVNELYNSGFFDDVSVDLTRRDDGVHLRLLLRERPSVLEVEFKENHHIDTDDLKEAFSTEVKAGSILSHAAIRRGIQKLRDKYAEEGYFLAEVSSEVVPARDNQVTIVLTINEHDPVTVRRISFIGNQNISDAELREVMITGTSGFFDFGSGGPFRQDAFERDVLVLSALYYDRGFLSVQVATPRVMLTPDRTGIEITVSITEGPRYKIRRLQVYERDADGREIEPLGGKRHLREMIRARSGDWFNRAKLSKDLASIQTLYRDAGYANVEATPATDLDPDTHEVDIIVGVKRNQLVRFGRIEVHGNTKTRDKVIRREMFIKEGELFSETKLENSKLRVTSLGYFERVDVSTAQGVDPEHLDVSVDIIEKPTGTFQVGAGFSSIESFIATAQVQQANLFGNGQSLSLQAQISGLRQLIDVRFYEPYFLDSPFSMSVNGYDQLRVYDQFSQTSLGGSLTVGYPIIAPKLRASLTYTLEYDKVSTQTTSTFFGTASTVSVFQRLPLANLFNDGLTSSIRPGLTYDTRNNALYPSAGIYLQGSVELAASALGSDNEFVRYRATGRFYYPVMDKVVLKLNTELGVVTSPNAQGVPIFARFFLGGILDLRGFPLRSVGPRLPLKESLDENAAAIIDGANIGGNLMYYQNLELEFPIIDAVGIRGVFFTDLGNAWNTESVYCRSAPASVDAVTNPCFNAGDLFNVRTSWGFGLRWFSPLGPLRFEWGFPFKPLAYEESSLFEFTIGNFF